MIQTFPNRLMVPPGLLAAAQAILARDKVHPFALNNLDALYTSFSQKFQEGYADGIGEYLSYEVEKPPTKRQLIARRTGILDRSKLPRSARVDRYQWMDYIPSARTWTGSRMIDHVASSDYIVKGAKGMDKKLKKPKPPTDKERIAELAAKLVEFDREIERQRGDMKTIRVQLDALTEKHATVMGVLRALVGNPSTQSD